MLEWHIVFGFSMKCTSGLFIRAIRIDSILSINQAAG